jgi:hypothetical protein
MSLWLRVFGTSDPQPEPAALLEHLHASGMTISGHFHGDDQGWFRAELVGDAEAVPLVLERFLATEVGIRAELSTWAAWLEAAGDTATHLRLMQQMIGAAQVFTLGPIDPDDWPEVEQLVLSLSRWLAKETAGVYQVDGQGFFAADGTLLVSEQPD